MMRPLPIKTRFRLRYRVQGGHTHVRLFAGAGAPLGKCGDLVFRNDEWEDFRRETGSTVIIPEDGQE